MICYWHMNRSIAMTILYIIQPIVNNPILDGPEVLLLFFFFLGNCCVRVLADSEDWVPETLIN